MFKNSILIIGLFILTSLSAEPLIYGELFSHASKVFKDERRYMVSLPEQYQSSSLVYPVLYIFDGDFQFHHVANTARHMARMGKIPPMIVVGIANQGPDDYLKSNTWAMQNAPEYGGIEVFSEYLRDELVPLINTHFRTSEHNALAGYSLGGLSVMYNYIDERSPFSAFLAMSPSVWYDDYAYKNRLSGYLNSRVERDDSSPQRQQDSTASIKSAMLARPLFISLANEQGMGVAEVVALLEKVPEGKLNWQYMHYPRETHYSTALPALYDGLQFLAPDYFIDIGEMMEWADYRQVLNEFEKKKSLWSGFNFGWLQSYTFAKYFFASKQQDKIDEALSLILRDFPASYNEILINLALIYNRKNEFESAKKLLRRIADKSTENAKWHYQLSLALRGLNQQEESKRHHRRAIELAHLQHLESWEVWEMEPDKVSQEKAN